MIETKTVLVLGAGASYPYGLPLGSGLKRTIRKFLSGGCTPAATEAIRRVYNEADVRDFCVTFEESGQESIDNFLARRTEFMDLGKLVIAAIIKDAEDRWKLFDRNTEDDDHWYEYLWNRLSGGSWEDLRNNQLSIITFNYDRSLETYLGIAMQNTYGKADVECAEMLKNTIPIVHVYGTVTGTYGASRGNNNKSDFLTPDALKESATSLTVIPEGRDDSPELHQARQMLSDADRIAFLGFGFDEINMKRLGGRATVRAYIDETHKQREVVGSAYLLTQMEISNLAQQYGLWGARSSIDRESWPRPLLNERSRMLLRETLILR